MQSFQTRVLALVIGLVIGIGVVIGALTLLQEDDGTSLIGLSTGSNQKGPVAPDGSTPKLGDPVTASTDVNNLIFPEQAFDRKVAIMSWIAPLTDEQILSWLEQSTDPYWDVSTEILTEFQSSLLQKLTTNAPEKAIAFAEEQSSDILASVVFQTWASSDLPGAIAHTKQLDDLIARNHLSTILSAREDLSLDRQRAIAKELGDENDAFVHYFNTLSSQGINNPRETWYKILNTADSENVQDPARSALNDVAVTWVEKEGLQILDEIVSSVSHDPEYLKALADILGTLSKDYPEAVVDFTLKTLGDQAYDLIQNSMIIYNWASNDPKAVLAKMETLPASGFRRNVVWRAVFQWADDNPREILREMELVPQEQQAQARQVAIRALTRISPNEAAKFVLQEDNPATRLILANSLVTNWSYQDAEAAKNWVLDLPENDPMRKELIRPLVMALVNTDPREAFQLALSQPIDENSSPYGSMGQESSIMSMIAYQNIDLAMELLPQVRDSGRAYAYTTVGTSLIQRGESRKAINLASQLSKEEQTRYFGTVSSTWAWQDPQGLLNSFDELPSAEVKSRVALQVSMANTNTKTYSDEEIARFERYMNEETKVKLKRYREIDFHNPSDDDRKLLQELYSW